MVTRQQPCLYTHTHRQCLSHKRVQTMDTQKEDLLKRYVDFNQAHGNHNRLRKLNDSQCWQYHIRLNLISLLPSELLRGMCPTWKLQHFPLRQCDIFTGAIYPIPCDHNSKDVMNLKSVFREDLSHDKYHSRACWQSARFTCILTVSPSLLVTNSRLGVQTACDIQELLQI